MSRTLKDKLFSKTSLISTDFLTAKKFFVFQQYDFKKLTFINKYIKTTNILVKTRSVNAIKLNSF